MDICFSKYQGLGNDFIVIDTRSNQEISKLFKEGKSIVRNTCNRKIGIGADGIVLIKESSNNANFNMQIFNSDGTEAEMCGNGIRCLIKYLYDNRIINKFQNIIVDTKAGDIKCFIDDQSNVEVDMGLPILDPNNIPTTLEKGNSKLAQGTFNLDNTTFQGFAVGMGNPHLIILVDNLESVNLNKWGPLLETNENFPLNTNVHFLQIINRNIIKLLVWERGCGPTLACGTGACASVVSTVIQDLTDNNVVVQLPGGDLDIKWENVSDSVFMKGPAQLVYKGSFESINND